MYFNFNGSGKMISYEDIRLKQRSVIFCLTGIALIFLCVLFFVVNPVIAVTIDEIKNQPIIYSPIQNLINNTYYNSTINESYVVSTGKIGGQILTGGTTNLNNLTLESNTFKNGYIYLNTTAFSEGAVGFPRNDINHIFTTNIYGNFILSTGAKVNRVRIKDNGYVGIGTMSPVSQLQTTGTVRFMNLGAGTVMSDSGGNLTSVSDEKLKTDIKPFSISALEALKKVIPITHKFKPESGLDTNNFYTGFSAQNLETAIPLAVYTKQDVNYETITKKDKNGKEYPETIEIPLNTTTKSISDRTIIATLILGIQEQQKQIDTLNDRLNKLEGK